jgi:hypothetical protein
MTDTTNGTNGHPPPNPPEPEPRNKLTYRLFVEVTDESGGTREVWEPDDLLMGTLGWVRAEAASDIAMAFAKAGEEQMAAMAIGMAGALGVAPSVPETSENAGGKMPSARLKEIATERLAKRYPSHVSGFLNVEPTVEDVIVFLDEQHNERTKGTP